MHVARVNAFHISGEAILVSSASTVNLRLAAVLFRVVSVHGNGRVAVALVKRKGAGVFRSCAALTAIAGAMTTIPAAASWAATGCGRGIPAGLPLCLAASAWGFARVAPVSRRWGARVD